MIKKYLKRLDESTIFIFLFSIFLILVVFLFIKHIKLVEDYNNCVNNSAKYDNRCIMYQELRNETMREISSKSNVNGLYIGSQDYYCVWVKDRTLTEIERTDYHEMCHSLVKNNYEHFCE